MSLSTCVHGLPVTLRLFRLLPPQHQLLHSINTCQPLPLTRRLVVHLRIKNKFLPASLSLSSLPTEWFQSRESLLFLLRLRLSRMLLPCNSKTPSCQSEHTHPPSSLLAEPRFPYNRSSGSNTTSILKKKLILQPKKSSFLPTWTSQVSEGSCSVELIVFAIGFVEASFH